MLRSFLFIGGAYFLCDPCRLLAYEIQRNSAAITKDVTDYLDINICKGNSTCEAFVETSTKLLIEKLSDPAVCAKLELCQSDPGTIIDEMTRHYIGDMNVGDIIKKNIHINDNEEWI